VEKKNPGLLPGVGDGEFVVSISVELELGQSDGWKIDCKTLVPNAESAMIL
jgi:hypothetical protein